MSDEPLTGLLGDLKADILALRGQLDAERQRAGRLELADKWNTEELAKSHVAHLEAPARADRLEAALQEIRAVVDEQAKDEGLWLVAQHISEGILQLALRRLHTAVEQVTK